MRAVMNREDVLGSGHTPYYCNPGYNNPPRESAKWMKPNDVSLTEVLATREEVVREHERLSWAGTPGVS